MRAMVLVLALTACHTGTSNTWTGAAVMTSLALGASAANRVAGGCYAVCQQGETCNGETGLCEALPCRGRCKAGESCEEGFFGVKCIESPALSASTIKSKPPPPPPPDEPEKPKVPDAARP